MRRLAIYRLQLAILTVALAGSVSCERASTVAVESPKPEVASPRVEETASAFTAEATARVKDAEVARQAGLYPQAADHLLKAIRADHSHPELFSEVARCLERAGQHLREATAIKAYLALAAEPKDRGRLSAGADSLQHAAKVTCEGLLDEAQQLLKKLPDGLDYVGSAHAALPDGASQEERLAEQEKNNTLDRQFHLKWETTEAIYDAYVRAGMFDKTDRYLETLAAGRGGGGSGLPYTNESRLMEPYRWGGPSLERQVDDLIQIRDWQRLREIRDTLSGRMYRAPAEAINRKIPDIVKEETEASAEHSASPINWDDYHAQINKIWENYAETHPIKPAAVGDWLELLDKSDPTEDVQSEYKRIKSLPDSEVETAPRKIALKAAEIGDYLWKLEELERRSAAATP